MKKTLTLVLVLCMLFTVCGFSATAETAEELPFMEITYVSWNCGEIEDGNMAEKTIEEKFNVDIKVERIDLSNDQQVELMLASGDLPEASWNVIDPFEGYYTQEVLRSIPREMIREYAPLYSAFLDEDPIAWNYFYDSETDSNYGLTGTNAAPKYQGRPLMVVRLDWMENLGLEIPEYSKFESLVGTEFEDRVFYTTTQWTQDELYAVMTAFTKNDPDGNGVDDTYGLQLDEYGDNFGWGIVANMFGMDASMNRKYTLMNEDGSADYPIATQNFHDMLAWLSSAYADGLLDKEFIAIDIHTAWEKFSNGQVGIMQTMLGTDYVNTTYQQRPPFSPICYGGSEEAKMLIMPVPTTNDGSFVSSNYSILPYNYYFEVSADVDDEKLARILQIFDYVNMDPEALVYYRYGEKDVHYTIDDSGLLQLNEGVVYGKDTGLCVFANYIDNPIATELLATPFMREEADIFYDGIYADHIIHPYRVDLFTNGGSEVYKEAHSNYGTAVSTLAGEYAAAVITGEKELDATWEEYLQELNDYGYNEIREAVNALPSYDDFINGNY